MDEMIVRALRGEASDIEARQLERWRGASPENERHYREARAIWRLTEEGAPPSGVRPALEDLVDAAERRRRDARGRARRRGLVRSPWPAWGLAAAAVATLTLVVASRTRAPEPEGPRLAAVESAAGVADVVTMSLTDGSVVRLAPSSAVEFPPDPDARVVRLTGRAFFAVTAADRPFVVRTGAGEVTVHGTRFEVREDEAGLRVVVVEGNVEVAGPGGSTRVAPGEVAVLSGRSAPAVSVAPDPWTLLDWDGGLLVFQATPLSSVVDELSRHFGREVRLGSAELAGRRITAWFDDESLEQVVDAVCLVAGAACAPVGVSGDVVVGR